MIEPNKPASPLLINPAPGLVPGERWIPIAHLLRPQGRRGEMLADLLTDQAEVFTTGQVCRLAKTETAIAAAPRITLETCWRPQGRHAGRVVLKLAGIDSISAAEALAGDTLFLPASRLPPLESGTYLVRDLLGCQLYDGTRLVGTVIDLQFPIAADGRTRLPDAADLLVVHLVNAPADAEPVLVPFVKVWLEAIDLNGRRVTMHLPPGLLGDAPEANMATSPDEETHADQP